MTPGLRLLKDADAWSPDQLVLVSTQELNTFVQSDEFQYLRDLPALVESVSLRLVHLLMTSPSPLEVNTLLEHINVLITLVRSLAQRTHNNTDLGRLLFGMVRLGGHRAILSSWSRLYHRTPDQEATHQSILSALRGS